MLPDSTVKEGWIDYDDWINSPTHILFFSDSSDRIGTRYNAGDILQFNVEGFQSYMRTPILNHCSYIPRRFRRQPELYNRLINDTVFFKVLVEGKYILCEFSHDDHIHMHFYSRKTGWEELHVWMRKTPNNDDDDHFNEGFSWHNGWESEEAYIDDDRFKDQLIRQIAIGDFSDADKIQLLKKIQSASVDQILGIVHEMNKGYAHYVSTRNWREGPQLYLSAGGSLGYSKLRFFEDELPPSAAVIPSLYVSAELRTSDYKSGVIARAACGMVSHNYPGFAFSTIDANISGLYSWVLSSQHRLYTGITLHFNTSTLSTSAQGKVGDQWFTYGNGWLAASWRAGLITKSHWEFGLEGFFLSGVTHPEVGGLNPNTYNMHVIRHLDHQELIRLFSPGSRRKR